MTDHVLYPAAFASRRGQIAARLGLLLHRAATAQRTRCALDELPDDLLRDIGLTRGDIDFVAGAIAHGDGDPTRSPLDRLNRNAARSATAAHKFVTHPRSSGVRAASSR